MSNAQFALFDDYNAPWEGMPSTRYQGSKRKLLSELYGVFRQLEFNTVLDAFGGTGSVTHLLRRMNKAVHYNDILPANSIIARALFSNRKLALKRSEVKLLFERTAAVNYTDTIQSYYEGIYFLDEENYQLDTFCANVKQLADSQAQAEAYYLLFQSMLCKRPYNLFHRANLEMRLKDVKRSFGNKATWDKPFITHMLKFYDELHDYRKVVAPHDAVITNQSAFEVETGYDLVYIDTPYAKSRGTQESNYFNFYHFLDAVCDYENIAAKAVTTLKHKPIYEFNKSWYPQASIEQAFKALFERFAKSTLVISYRSDGHPTSAELQDVLRTHYATVREEHLADYKYALSSEKVDTKELAIVACQPRV